MSITDTIGNSPVGFIKFDTPGLLLEGGVRCTKVKDKTKAKDKTRRNVGKSKTKAKAKTKL